MKRSVGAAAMMCAALFVLGCDKKGDDAGSSAGGPSEGSSVEQALGAANKESGGRLFDETLTKKACEVLTPEHVGRTFGIPAAEIKATPMLGCTYTWRSETAEETHLDARFATIKAHKDEEAAKRWFSNATKSMSQEETKEAMAAITRKTKEREEIDTKAKEKAVDQVGGAVVGLTGSDGIRFESVDGVGDAARFERSGGALWIRTGNLTFVVSAYHGPPAPKPNLQGVGLQEMAKAALAANREWLQDTMSKRKEDAEKLASVILKALP